MSEVELRPDFNLPKGLDPAIQAQLWAAIDSDKLEAQIGAVGQALVHLLVRLLWVGFILSGAALALIVVPIILRDDLGRLATMIFLVLGCLLGLCALARLPEYVLERDLLRESFSPTPEGEPLIVVRRERRNDDLVMRMDALGSALLLLAIPFVVVEAPMRSSLAIVLIGFGAILLYSIARLVVTQRRVLSRILGFACLLSLSAEIAVFANAFLLRK